MNANSDSRGSSSSRSRAGSVSAIVRTKPCLGGVNSAILAFHCSVDDDRPGLEVDLLPGERVQFPWTHPLVDGRVQERGERGRRQLVGELDEPGDLGLPRWLRVTPAATRAQPEFGERVPVDEPARRSAGRVC